MSIFRKNYLPKVVIHQDVDGKWFADDGSYLHNPNRKVFVGGVGLTEWQSKTKFETIDDLFVSLYDYACEEHIRVIKNKITYSKVNVQL